MDPSILSTGNSVWWEALWLIAFIFVVVMIFRGVLRMLRTRAED